jgi:uncharacterized protein YndB with AHSA1/START domain
MSASLDRNSAAFSEGERVLLVTRVFKAPRTLVFKAWTDPKHLVQWWGPKDFTNPVCEVDVWSGGTMRIHMRDPDGALS